MLLVVPCFLLVYTNINSVFDCVFLACGLVCLFLLCLDLFMFLFSCVALPVVLRRSSCV